MAYIKRTWTEEQHRTETKQVQVSMNIHDVINTTLIYIIPIPLAVLCSMSLSIVSSKGHVKIDEFLKDEAHISVSIISPFISGLSFEVAIEVFWIWTSLSG